MNIQEQEATRHESYNQLLTWLKFSPEARAAGVEINNVTLEGTTTYQHEVRVGDRWVPVGWSKETGYVLCDIEQDASGEAAICYVRQALGF